MKLRFHFIAALLVLTAVPLVAHQYSVGYYTSLRERGVQKKFVSEYAMALNYWEFAKKYSNEPNPNSLQILINKFKNKLNIASTDYNSDGVSDSLDSYPKRKGATPNNGSPIASSPVPNFRIVLVRGGTFTMGCTSEQVDCYDDEKPPHQVTLSDFYISKYEVTQKEWRSVMGSTSSFSGNIKRCNKCPVENVSWDDIQVFLARLNTKTGITYRLPTEAEWEYAARGGAFSRGYLFAGSNTLDDVAWYDDNASEAQPIGKKKPNELGLYDMSGNVWEWCSDWKGTYLSSPQFNPQGSSTGSRRISRGGSWINNEGGVYLIALASNRIVAIVAWVSAWLEHLNLSFITDYVRSE